MTGILRSVIHAAYEQKNILIVTFILANLIFNVVANAGFKMSADSSNFRGFLFWQVVGNLAGLVTVLTLTALLRYWPLNIAFPVTTGLMIIGVQVFASRWLFGETISPMRWFGTVLIVIGVVFVSRW